MAGNDFAAIGSAIYSTLNGTVGGLTVYRNLAVQGAALPYVLFQRQSNVDEYTWSHHHAAPDYVVKVVSNRRSDTEAVLAYGTVHNTLQDAALTVTGYNALRCERRSTIEYQDGDGFWHVGGVYRIEVVETI